MSVEYPLINGHTYSFASIELKIHGDLCLGVTEANYAESVNSIVVYGSDPRRAGRTVGPRKLTADLTLLRREWDAVLKRIDGNFGRLDLLVSVTYSEGRDLPTITDTIEGYISGVESSNREGSEPATVKLTLDPTDITWDGNSLEEEPNGGDFWIQNETGIEGPDYAANQWDVVTIDGVRLPGLSTVKGLPQLSFDKKKAGGVDGATVTVNGYLPGPIEIECRMWTPSQWRIFQRDVASKIWRRPNKGKTSADKLKQTISHPALAVWGIQFVVVLGVSVLEAAAIDAVKVVKIKCVEFVPIDAKKNRTGTPKSTVPIAPELSPAKNQAGEAPSKTDIHPGGKAVTRKGGVS